MSQYRFIEAERQHHAVSLPYRVPEVSRAAYCRSSLSRPRFASHSRLPIWSNAASKLPGRAIAPHMRADLVKDALRMDITNRGGQVRLVIFRSDRGAQYEAGGFMDLADQAGVRQSMGRVADTGKTRSALVHWIEAVYSRRRRHSSIGMLAPVVYEERHQVQCNAA